MARLPLAQKLTLEQLKGLIDEGDDPNKALGKVLEKLIPSVNGLVDGAGSLNKQLTLGDNHAAQVFTVNVDMPSSDWVDATFQNGWSNFGSIFETAGYRKHTDGLVEIKGLIKTGSIGTFFTLPESYRPASGMIFAQWCGSGGGITTASYQLDVHSDGQVSGSPPQTAYVSVRCSFTASDRSPATPGCFPVYQRWDIASPPTLCWVGKVVDREDNSQLALNPMSLNWEYVVKDGASNVRINNVTGLQYGRKYAITLVALVG